MIGNDCYFRMTIVDVFELRINIIRNNFTLTAYIRKYINRVASEGNYIFGRLNLTHCVQRLLRYHVKQIQRFPIIGRDDFDLF